MKKILLLFVVFVLFLSFSPVVKAEFLCQIQNATGNPNDIDPAAVNPGVQPTIENFISMTTGKGFVPCGITSAIRKSWSCQYTVNGTNNSTYQNIIAEDQANANAACDGKSWRCRWTNSSGGSIYQNVIANNQATANAYCASITQPGNTFQSSAANAFVPPARQTAQVEGILCPCQLPHLFILLLKIFKFLLFFGTLIAGLMITIGGVLIVLSGGPGGNNPVTGLVNPNMYSTAKKMVMYSIMGVLTMFCAWLIINILMVRILGIPFAWNVLWF